MKKKLITLTLILMLVSILPACNKPKKTKGADNAVTRYHKRQIDKVKEAKAAVKKLNIDLKQRENRTIEIKNKNE